MSAPGKRVLYLPPEGPVTIQEVLVDAPETGRRGGY